MQINLNPSPSFGMALKTKIHPRIQHLFANVIPTLEPMANDADIYVKYNSADHIFLVKISPLKTKGIRGLLETTKNFFKGVNCSGSTFVQNEVEGVVRQTKEEFFKKFPQYAPLAYIRRIK